MVHAETRSTRTGRGASPLCGPNEAIALLFKIAQAPIELDSQLITVCGALVKRRQLVVFLPKVDQLASTDDRARPGASERCRECLWPLGDENDGN